MFIDNNFFLFPDLGDLLGRDHDVTAFSSATKKIEDKLASHFSTRVVLRHHKNGSGQISLDYYSLDELNKLLDQMDVSID